MVISELVQRTASMLRENARFEAELIVMKVLSLSRTELVLNSHLPVKPDSIQKAADAARRRQSGEPLQYILGECEFMGLDFFVRPGVLIPRPDTETLVEEILKLNIGKSLLDICAGSGCIGISIAYYNKNIIADLADISDIAVNTAAQNIARNDLTDRVKITKMDILNEYPDKHYDIIVSNPPYIETDVIETLQIEVRNFEPHIALDGGFDGLDFYRRIVCIAPMILNRGGLLAFEIGYNQSAAVSALMEKDFEQISVVKDLCGNDRVVTGFLKKESL